MMMTLWPGGLALTNDDLALTEAPTMALGLSTDKTVFAIANKDVLGSGLFWLRYA